MAEVIWQPGDLLSGNPILYKQFALIVLNQPLELRPAFYAKLWEKATYRVGADGGANRAHDVSLSLVLETVVGDLDSLRQEVGDNFHDMGSELIRDTDQYSTDFTKAVNYLRTFKVAETATLRASNRQEHLTSVQQNLEVKDIVVLGGLGGRVDQGMSTLHQLFIFQNEINYTAGRIFLLSSESITFVLKSGRHKIQVRRPRGGIDGVNMGKHIGIIPLREPSVITTDGLEWDVKHWKTEFGGQISTSNHVREEWVTIETTNDVLFTIDLDQSS